MSSALELEMALNVLCNISQQALQPYKPKALLAFQKLQIFVDGLDPAATLIPQASSVCALLSGGIRGSSLSKPSTRDQDSSVIAPSNSLGPQDSHSSSTLPSTPPSTGERSVTPRTDRLIQSLSKQSVQIQEFLSKTEPEAVSKEPEWVSEDPRIVDLKLDGERSSDRLKVKFRKGLSQRSLAIEYNQWEIDAYGTSRVDELVYNLSSAKTGKSGHITEYVERNERFADKATASKGIGHGLKLLVVERLLSTNSTSAILIFGHRKFREIKFEEFDYLTTQLKDLEWATAILEHEADWFNKYQETYDASCEKYSYSNKPNTLTPHISRVSQGFPRSIVLADIGANTSQKRRRLDLESSSNTVQPPIEQNIRELDGHHLQHVQVGLSEVNRGIMQCPGNNIGDIGTLTEVATMMLDSPIRYDTHQHLIDHQSSVQQDGTSNGALSDIANLNPHFSNPPTTPIPPNLLDHEANNLNLSGGLDMAAIVEHFGNQSCYDAATGLNYMPYSPYSVWTDLPYNTSTTGQPSENLEYNNDFRTLS